MLLQRYLMQFKFSRFFLDSLFDKKILKYIFWTDSNIIDEIYTLT